MTLDTFFRIADDQGHHVHGRASAVEQGKLTVDDPAGHDPALSSPQSDGFDAAGAPILRPVKRPITCAT
jgi:hypothetical protein